MWTCFYCGYPNQERHEVCERCGTEKRGNEVEETYKTSEMIAMLEENPRLKFTRRKATFGYGGAVECKNGILRGVDGEHYPFVLSLHNEVMDDWQLVREPPVPVWEALKAWMEGKTVYCIHKDCVPGKCVHTAQGVFACNRGLKEGTWYIGE